MVKWVLTIDVEDEPINIIAWISKALTEEFKKTYGYQPEGQIILSPVGKEITSDDCGNCEFKYGCKFSSIVPDKHREAKCIHYKCCYGKPASGFNEGVYRDNL